MSLIFCQLAAPVTILWALLLSLSPSTVLAAGSAAADAVNIENDVLHFSYALESWLDAGRQRPCQDFYAYVCDRSLNTSQSQQEERERQEEQRFDNFLTADNEDQLMDVELKVKHFYESCKNARSVGDLKSSFLYRTSGGWPAIDDAPAMIRKRRNMTWMGVLGAFHDVGVGYFFRHHVEIKSNKRVVLLRPEATTRYTLRKFEQLASDVLQEYSVEPGRARLVALEILSFERSRREILKSAEVAESQVELSYEEFKATQVVGGLPIDWDAYFRKILGKPLKPTDTVLVQQLPTLGQYFELLQNTTMTRLLNWIWIDYLMDKTTGDCRSLVQTYFRPVYEHIVERAAIDRVQMAQMYADIGRAYDQLLPSTPWIDEISQQNSKQFLGRTIHLTLNGDAKLDADFLSLSVTKRNFYRNVEKAQRNLAKEQKSQRPSTRVLTNAVEVSEAVGEFLGVFAGISALLEQRNLTAPLNYVLVGERFAEHMIAAGSSSTTPGAWRSMDSEREFAAFTRCLAAASDKDVNYNLNDLILKMLAQRQTLQAMEEWQRRLQQEDAGLLRRLDSLLGAGMLQLSVRKLYFVGTLLTDCQRQQQQKNLVHAYLRNSLEFTAAFGCKAGDDLYARNVCKVI